MCLSHFQNNKYKQTKYTISKGSSGISVSSADVRYSAHQKKKKTLLAHLRPHTFVMIATAQKKMNRIFIVQKSIESLLSCCRLRIFFRFFSLVQRGESRNEKNKTFNKQKKEKKIAVNEIELTYSFTAFYSCSSLYLPVSLAFFSSSLFHVFSTHKMHRGKKRQTTRQEQ